MGEHWKKHLLESLVPAAGAISLFFLWNLFYEVQWRITPEALSTVAPLPPVPIAPTKVGPKDTDIVNSSARHARTTTTIQKGQAKTETPDTQDSDDAKFVDADWWRFRTETLQPAAFEDRTIHYKFTISSDMMTLLGAPKTIRVYFNRILTDDDTISTEQGEAYRHSADHVTIDPPGPLDQMSLGPMGRTLSFSIDTPTAISLAKVKELFVP